MKTGVLIRHVEESLARGFRCINLWIAIFAVTVGSTLSMSVPPMQSPDESDHIRRAYMLTRGVVVLDTPAGRMSGGPIDSGLESYVHTFHALTFQEHWKDRKSMAEYRSINELGWSGERSFKEVPGTGYYFPLVYVPQAIGLALGEAAGATIDTSYRLARFLALLVSVGLCLLAFRVHRPSPFVLALLVIPMSVFQIIAGSIDGLSNSLLLIVVSLFLRQMQDPDARSSGYVAMLCAAIFAVVTCRFHLLPLVLLPLILYIRTRRLRDLLCGLVLMAGVFVWTYVAMRHTVDTRANVGASAGTILLYYITQPFEFLKVVGRTLTDPDMLKYYGQSFIGRLSSLEVRYTSSQYIYMSAALLVTAALSFGGRDIKSQWLERSALLGCAIAAIPLTFLAMLISWTPHPAHIVLGVQGRYFMGPAILMAYALAGSAGTTQGLSRKLAIVLVIVLAFFSLTSITPLMLERYYLLP